MHLNVLWAILIQAISVPVSWATPQPATIIGLLVYSTPESLKEWAFEIRIVAYGIFSLMPIAWRRGNALSTAAFTKFGKGKLGLDKLWGMLLHSNSPFVTLLKPADGSNRRAGNSISAHIIAQVGT